MLYRFGDIVTFWQNLKRSCDPEDAHFGVVCQTKAIISDLACLRTKFEDYVFGRSIVKKEDQKCIVSSTMSLFDRAQYDFPPFMVTIACVQRLYRFRNVKINLLKVPIFPISRVFGALWWCGGDLIGISPRSLALSSLCDIVRRWCFVTIRLAALTEHVPTCDGQSHMHKNSCPSRFRTIKFVNATSPWRRCMG